MTTPKRPSSAAQSWSTLYRVAIVGASTLKGKEVKELLEESHFPASDVRLLDDDESLGQLSVVGDEPAVIQAVKPEHFESVDLAIFASDADFTRRNWRYAQAAGCAIVDMSYGLEEEAAAHAAVRSPWLEKELVPSREKLAAFDLQHSALVACHPAATMIGLLLLRAQNLGEVARSVVTVFDPVSEEGRRGMDELHQQTLNLLSFQPMPKDFFDVQVAFNMVSRYGLEAKASLGSVESRIFRHLKTALGNRSNGLSLQVLQAPTFHSHTMSLMFEFADEVRVEQLVEALGGEHISIIGADEDAPNNVNAAGQADVLVTVRPDANQPRSFWLWAAADNLKIAAATAMGCGSSLLAARTTGKIQ